MWDELIVGSNRIKNASGVLLIDEVEQIVLERGQSDNRLLVSIDVYDENHNRLAKLRRNAWPFADGRFNVDTNPESLTLRDAETGEVILDVAVHDAKTVEVRRAQFFTPRGQTIVIDPDALTVNGIVLRGNYIDVQGQAIVIDDSGLRIGVIKREETPLPTPAGKKFQDESVRLSDLVDSRGLLRKVAFRNCEIIGPSIIFLTGQSIVNNNEMGGSFTDVLWRLPEQPRGLAGVIALEDCEIDSCRFVNVGFAVSEADADAIVAGPESR